MRSRVNNLRVQLSELLGDHSVPTSVGHSAVSDVDFERLHSLTIKRLILLLVNCSTALTVLCDMVRHGFDTHALQVREIPLQLAVWPCLLRGWNLRACLGHLVPWLYHDVLLGLIFGLVDSHELINLIADLLVSSIPPHALFLLVIIIGPSLDDLMTRLVHLGSHNRIASTRGTLDPLRPPSCGPSPEARAQHRSQPVSRLVLSKEVVRVRVRDADHVVSRLRVVFGCAHVRYLACLGR